MPVNQTYLNQVLDQLAEVEDFTHKKMFGGIGFFRDGAMWGAIMGEHDTFRLKVDAENQAPYEEAGSSPFEMEMRGQTRSMPYWTVPEHVFADKKLLAEWVEIAADAAVQAKKKK